VYAVWRQREFRPRSTQNAESVNLSLTRKDNHAHTEHGLPCICFFLSRSATVRFAPHRTPQTRPSASTVEQEIVTAVRARANAFASGDCQTYATFIATDFRDIEGAHTATRKEILEGCQQEARPLSPMRGSDRR
jgi:hypothetical protein